MTSDGDWLNAGRLRDDLKVESVYSGFRLDVVQAVSLRASLRVRESMRKLTAYATRHTHLQTTLKEAL
jgi:hypothetical protein